MIGSTSQNNSKKNTSCGILGINKEDIQVDKCLGSGSFANVYSIRSIATSNGNKMERGSEWVMKTLSPQTLLDNDARDVLTAEKDLANEAAILLKLPRHENIIELHAVCSSFVESSETHFLVLERLSETLNDRLAYWKATSKRFQNGHSRLRLFQSGKRMGTMKMKRMMTMATNLSSKAQSDERVNSVGLGLANALAFLHRKRILHRDIKPMNVGFGMDGITVKLFDFGLSVSLDHPDSNQGARLMTQFIGTPRFMAPETMVSTSYGFPADVYSFSILMWQVATLEKPYGNPKSLENMIRQITHGKRPCLQAVQSSISSSLSPGLKQMLQRGWSADPSLRPSMAEFVQFWKERQMITTEPLTV